MGRPLRKPDTGQRMVSSKSAGNVMLDQYGNPVSPRQTPHNANSNQNAIKRAKSDYVIQDDDFQRQYIANFKIAQSRENQVFHAPRQQRKSQQRPQSAGRASTNSSSGGTTPRRSQNPPKSAGTPNDVFTPRSDASSARSNRGPEQVFHFDTPRSQQHLSPPYSNTNNMSRPSTLTPGARQTDTGVEVKQIQKGQLRAFCLSAKSPQTHLPPPERQTPLKSTENISKMPHNVANDRDIEAKLKRLNDSERAFQQICDDAGNLLAERERLTAELSIAKFKMRNRHSSGLAHDTHQLDMEQHKLEQELGNVNAQLANSVQKLKEMTRQNDNFNYEMRRLKTSIVEELRNQGPITENVYDNVSNQNKERKRRLEWELGRIEFIIEGLNKQKSAIVDKINSLNLNKGDESPTLLSPKTPPASLLSANTRSPRDVKRTSMERRTTPNRPSYSSTSSSGTPNTTPVKKYFTLPGRGVPHATSVDSVTAESLMKTSSSRPTSARSVSSIGSSNLSNLHRTKSAAERLFQTPYSNQSYDYEAKEMKRLQKEITRNRRNNLKSGSVGDMSGGMTLPARSHVKVGVDVQMALKHHRMPKVLQRAKRDMARAEHDRNANHQIELDIDDLERQVNPKSSGLYGYDYEKVKETIGSARQHEEVQSDDNDNTVDVNLTHQLITPDKVEIPERYVEYEDVELSPAEEKMKYRKMAAIERILAKSGQQASLPAVHLAAALAVEAGSVARAVAMHASAPQRQPGDGQKELPVPHLGRERPVTDGSSSAGEDLEVEMISTPLTQDPEYTAAYIV